MLRGDGVRGVLGTFGMGPYSVGRGEGTSRTVVSDESVVTLLLSLVSVRLVPCVGNSGSARGCALAPVDEDIVIPSVLVLGDDVLVSVIVVVSSTFAAVVSRGVRRGS